MITEPALLQKLPHENRIPEPLPERPFGRGSTPMPVLGLGGQSLIQHAKDESRAIELIQEAIRLGIRYIDTAPVYGESEVRIGKAIQGHRESVFLATKTLYRRASAARRSFERSLARLQTPYVDSLQLHCLMHPSEINVIFGKRGVLSFAEKLKEEGMVRHIGITGHYQPDILSEMLRRYPFDSVLIPVNVADPRHLSFTQDTLQVANQTGASVVAMKVMGAGLLTHKGVDASVLLSYALSCPVSVAIVSCRHLRDLHENIQTTLEFRPLPPNEMSRIENGQDPELMEACNNIYKRVDGRPGLKLRLRNRLAAEATKLLPGWWHF